MSVEDRIRYLLRAACRAEEEGKERVASLLRRMAREALPLGDAMVLPAGGCGE
jgi:hypothetical protein